MVDSGPQQVEDKEKMRQLTIAALWCIQWNPKNRSSMTKVVNMLTGRLQNLQIPPKPFISSGNHPMQARRTCCHDLVHIADMHLVHVLHSNA